MSNRYLLIAGVAMLSLSITSCGSGTTAMFRGDPAHTGVLSDSGPKSLDTLKWKFTTPDKVYASPVASDKEVYQGCNDGYLYAVNADTGLLNWKFRTEANIESTPALVNGVLYVGSWDNSLYAIDAETHGTRWKFPTRGPVSSSPAVVDGVPQRPVAPNCLDCVAAAPRESPCSQRLVVADRDRPVRVARRSDTASRPCGW